MISTINKIRHYGLVGSARIVLLFWYKKLNWRICLWRCRNAPKYANPTLDELKNIERALLALGVKVEDFSPLPDEFRTFQEEQWFPADYHGGKEGGVWDEKLLEHWLSSKLLNLMNYDADDIYVDVAASSSPWVRSLRERTEIAAYAIDLSPVGTAYKHLPFYRVENATQTSFSECSVKGASLHCAFEMFIGEDDIELIHEIARILKPGGKVVILPLYMHTHYCSYSTPEYFGKGCSDASAKEYVRLDCAGIPSSRKYDATMFKQRIVDTIEKLELRYRLIVVRNKAELGDNIYCHFILEITR